MKTVILKLIQDALSRLQNAENAIIDYLLNKGMFVQPLRLALDSIDVNGNKSVHAGLYNTLSPYLIDSRILLSSTLYEGNDYQSNVNIENYQSNQDEHISENAEAEINSQETFDLSLDVEHHSNQKTHEEVFDLMPEKDPKPGKKKKKKKKNIYPQTEQSLYTQWLSGRKSLDPQVYAIKKVKKSKKYKLILETAQKSITPSDEIISEPLAKILVAQGHLLEAKKMYKKLMQKHPELSAKYGAEVEIINKMMDENR